VAALQFRFVWSLAREAEEAEKMKPELKATGAVDWENRMEDGEGGAAPGIQSMAS
jgi:hypothetical protein